MQPLGVCLTYQRTLQLVKGLSQDHDAKVQEWADEQVKHIDKQPGNSEVIFSECICALFIEPLEIHAACMDDFLLFAGGHPS